VQRTYKPAALAGSPAQAARRDAGLQQALALAEEKLATREREIST